MPADRRLEVLREVFDAFNRHDVEVRGCDLWTFADDDRILRKDSFWKIRSRPAGDR